MELSEYIATAGVTPAALARDVGCHRSYITRVAAGERKLSREAALKIWRCRKVKLGPLANVSDPDLRALARVLLEQQAA